MARSKTIEFVVQVPERYLKEMASSVSDHLNDEFSVKLKAKEILARDDFVKNAHKFIQSRLDYLGESLDTYEFVYDSEFDTEKAFAPQIREAEFRIEEEERVEAAALAAKRAKQPLTVAFSIPRGKEEAIIALLKAQGLSPTVV